MKRFASWSLYAAFVLILVIIGWFIYLRSVPRFGEHFDLKARIVSEDNFYNPYKQAYSGKILSKTLYSYHVTGQENRDLLIENVFDVRKPSGEQIFVVKRKYAVDKITGAHNPQKGDRKRSGYLFAPMFTGKDDFVYWHINYDQPLLMKFDGEEQLQNLNLFRFKCSFKADQTNNLAHLDGVPESRGVELDVDLYLWIEPETGFLIKYEDFATAWFYDKSTHHRLHPWNQFHNEFDKLSIATQLSEARHIKKQQRWSYFYFPGFLVLLLTILLVTGWDFRKQHLWRLYLSVGLVGLSGIAISISYYTTLKENNRLKMERNFEQICEDVRSTIKREVEASVSSLYPIKILFTINPQVTQKEFSLFVQDYQRRRRIAIPISWTPLIPEIHRQTFEQSLLDTYQKNYVMKEVIDQTQIVPAKKRSIHAPVCYIEPLEGNTRAIGFDLMSDPIRSKVLKDAREMGEVCASETIALVQDRNQSSAVLLALAVQQNDSTIGYITAPIRIKDLIVNAFSVKSIPKDIQFSIFDNKGKRMHRENGRLKKGAFEKTSSLTIGNKIWSMEFKSSPRFGTNALDSLELFGLIGGIVISISLGALLFILQTDNRKSLARSNQRLEAELMERQKAEEKLVEIEQFDYIASHDLQEPLRTVSNYVNLLKDGFTEKLTSNDKRILSTIESATERMQILIRDLLEYSRISMEQNRQPVNLNFMLSDIQNDLEAMITEAKAKFDVGELPTIMAYSSGIKSVFQNLIQNAIKFRKADVTPLIRIRCVEKEHEYRFSVSDNGIGIDSVHYGKIFVLFKRLFHVSEYPGTGIGLAQVKKIVELHGGRIWLESELGKGTTFFFDIPKSKT